MSTPAKPRRVYCAEDAPLRLAGDTPLHLEWIIEGGDGELYRVPAEPGGWFRRNQYRGQPHRLKMVPAQKARAIMWLTYADTDDADSASATERSLEHWGF